MEYIGVILVAALVFGVCFLADKGFHKVFRSASQHKSGKTVRLNSKNAAFGLIMAVVGLGAVFSGLTNGWFLLAGGGVLILLGIGLVAYYMSFGVFYDQDSFIVNTFGKRSATYYYRDIQNQQLYKNYSQIVIELHMKDGSAVQLQSGMTGVYDFLDHAFYAWLRQTGRRREDCTFYDPKNSCWFPPVEG